MDKENEKIFSIIAFFLMVITIVLTIMNINFLASSMLMTALFIFSICYIIKDNKKILTYILFIVGVLLIIASLAYTYMRVF